MRRSFLTWLIDTCTDGEMSLFKRAQQRRKQEDCFYLKNQIKLMGDVITKQSQEIDIYRKALRYYIKNTNVGKVAQDAIDETWKIYQS